MVRVLALWTNSYMNEEKLALELDVTLRCEAVYMGGGSANTV